jgi:hypothetical protein
LLGHIARVVPISALLALFVSLLPILTLPRSAALGFLASAAFGSLLRCFALLLVLCALLPLLLLLA